MEDGTLLTESKLGISIRALNMWRRIRLVGPGLSLVGGSIQRNFTLDDVELSTWRTLSYEESANHLARTRKRGYRTEDMAVLVHQGHPELLLEQLQNSWNEEDLPLVDALNKKFINFYVIDDLSYKMLGTLLVNTAQTVTLLQFKRLTKYHQYLLWAGVQGRETSLRVDDCGTIDELKNLILRTTIERLGHSPYGTQSVLDEGATRKQTTSIRSMPAEGTVLQSSEITLSRRESAYQEWCDEGRAWINGADKNGLLIPGFIRTLFDLGCTWDKCHSDWESDDELDEWFDSIARRFNSLKKNFTFVPVWPMEFRSKKLRIILTESNGRIAAWVETQEFGILVSLNMRTLQISSRASAEQELFAAGLAISWFIDCCICLEPRKRHPHYSRKPHTSPKSKSQPQRRGLVLPTPRFESDVASRRKAHSASRVAHQVRGHRRKLAVGHQPSEEALQNAPAFVRKNLRTGETFVRSHARGEGEVELNLRVELSRFSSLADSLSILKSF
jgi:hypothetical protein